MGNNTVRQEVFTGEDYVDAYYDNGYENDGYEHNYYGEYPNENN